MSDTWWIHAGRNRNDKVVYLSTRKTVGAVIRRARTDGGFTQAELARRSGVSIRTIRNLEGDRITAPRQSSLEALATVLQLEPQAKPPARPPAATAGPDDVLDAVIAALDAAQLITTSGVYGIDKVRLAQVIAEELQTIAASACRCPWRLDSLCPTPDDFFAVSR
ncbi:helix-turn-helix domain-containing protein [Kribbella sandramycini]|uniref:Transcriptional regulator with XRE-family HTH domain n=1 Tax=Kribbella sandramycini TaxID=60450 RepID=A0A841SDV0_9ACTN|nr:transcriptional regulator with XRE-family HTH domain [Kribbella sandramycini]